MNRFMRLRAARLNAVRDQPEPEPPRTPSVDKWSTRAASWAQVGTLLLLGVGYVLTVRPVFQYQLLQEQNAKLELQNAAARATLKETLAKQAAAAQELTTLANTLERTNRERATLEKALRMERGREEEARKAAAASAGEAAAQSAALEEAQKRMLIYLVAAEQMAAIADSNANLTNAAWTSHAALYEKDWDGHFISDAKASWPDPYKQIVAYIDDLTSHSAGADVYPNKTVELLKMRLERARNEGSRCQAVDFDKMKTEFLAEIAAAEPVIAQDVAAEVDRLKRSETNPFIRLVIDKNTLETLTRNARIDRRGEIVKSYWERVFTLRADCDAARFRLILAMVGRAEAQKAPP